MMHIIGTLLILASLENAINNLKNHTFITISGRTVKLANYFDKKGKPYKSIVLLFYNPEEYTISRQYLDSIEKINRSFYKRIFVFAISLGDYYKWEILANYKIMRLSVPNLIGNITVSEIMGFDEKVDALPYLVVIDSDGKISGTHEFLTPKEIMKKYKLVK